MEVRINKEVRDYQEAIFFGLSLRQFLFAILSVGVAVAVYFGLRISSVPAKWAGCAFLPPCRSRCAAFSNTTA